MAGTRPDDDGLERVLEALGRTPPPDEEALEASNWPPGLGLLLGVEVTCSVELGSAPMELGEVLSLRRTSVIVLDGEVDAPVLLRVNGVPFASGDVVESGGRYGLRIGRRIPGRSRGGRTGD